MIRYEGLYGFYKGMGTKIVQSVLAAAVLFMVKEELVRGVRFLLAKDAAGRIKSKPQWSGDSYMTHYRSLRKLSKLAIYLLLSFLYSLVQHSLPNVYKIVRKFNYVLEKIGIRFGLEIANWNISICYSRNIWFMWNLIVLRDYYIVTLRLINLWGWPLPSHYVAYIFPIFLLSLKFILVFNLIFEIKSHSSSYAPNGQIGWQ